MGTIAFDLLLGGYCAEDNLCELSPFEFTIGYTTGYVSCFHFHLTFDVISHPSTSSGLFTMTIDKYVLSYTSRATYSLGIFGNCF